MRLSGTADFASKPIVYISTGSRNSPPPNPIRPPSSPIGMHQPNALRKYGQPIVRCIPPATYPIQYNRRPFHLTGKSDPPVPSISGVDFDRSSGKGGEIAGDGRVGLALDRPVLLHHAMAENGQRGAATTLASMFRLDHRLFKQTI